MRQVVRRWVPVQAEELEAQIRVVLYVWHDDERERLLVTSTAVMSTSMSRPLGGAARRVHQHHTRT